MVLTERVQLVHFKRARPPSVTTHAISAVIYPFPRSVSSITLNNTAHVSLSLSLSLSFFSRVALTFHPKLFCAAPLCVSNDPWCVGLCVRTSSMKLRDRTKNTSPISTTGFKHTRCLLVRFARPKLAFFRVQRTVVRANRSSVAADAITRVL